MARRRSWPAASSHAQTRVADLTVVRRILLAHGGNVHVASSKAGTCIQVSVSASQRPDADAQNELSGSDLSGAAGLADGDSACASALERA